MNPKEHHWEYFQDKYPNQFNWSHDTTIHKGDVIENTKHAMLFCLTENVNVKHKDRRRYEDF